MGLIRLLLASAVLLGHLNPGGPLSLLRPEAAVEAFFVISGFYMAMVLDGKYRHHPNSYCLFLGSRALRLYPTYLLVASATLLVQAVAYWRYQASVGAFASLVVGTEGLLLPARLLAGLTNLSIIGQDFLMLATIDAGLRAMLLGVPGAEGLTSGHALLLVPQAWSVAMELSFYAVAPWLMRRSLRDLAMLLACSFTGRYAALSLGAPFDPWVYRLFPFEVGFFIAGVLGYRLFTHPSAPRWWTPTDPFRPMLALLALGAAILFFEALPGGPEKPALLTIALIFGVPYLFTAFAKSTWDRGLGDLSYPLYLVHFLVAYVLTAFGKSGLLVNLAASLIVSAGIVLLVERPLDRWRQQWIRNWRGGKPAESAQ